ncbi:winged helix-turn-helix domain-containing protein [Bacillus xiapuensis]|uniref:winged helix-turn-helix domain-containing protein n=1 Tax=Bacillus xiapuensis TaxID=2014075 RepID=UPI000C23FC48|nr:winged helix-turn-helix domain-containing protein [Bacillus xiapuensis]
MKKALICSENSYFSAYIKHLFTPYGIETDCVNSIEKLNAYTRDNMLSFVVFDTCLQTDLSVKIVQKIGCPLIIMNSLAADASPNKYFTPFLELFNNFQGPRKIVEELAPYTFFDVGKHCIWRKEEYVPLATQEFKILYLLYLNLGKVVSSEELINYADLTSRSSLYVHINSLREKVEENCGNPQIILTKFGKGYQIYKHKAEIKLIDPKEQIINEERKKKGQAI